MVRSHLDTSTINGAILLAGFDVEHKPAGGEHLPDGTGRGPDEP
ncbi:hypothetical protein [Microvirga sp. VF16]|nr:hypothetical protein [Microvirga sp. VF16]